MQRRYVSPSLLFFFIVYSYGCAPLEVRSQKDATVNVPTNAKFVGRVSDLQLSLEPYYEKDRLQQQFGCDLISIGILPVLVIMENHSSDKSFFLEKGKFKLVTSGHTGPDKSGSVDKLMQKSSTDRDVIYTLAKEGNEEKQRGLLFGSLAPILVPIPLTLPVAVFMINSGDQKINDAIFTKENISRKEFVDRTIYPGELHNGFIYFQIKSRDEADEIVAIGVKVKELRSQGDVDFMIDVINK
jgi:hypothetical protein